MKIRKSVNPMDINEIFEIPAHLYYGAQTYLSKRNFTIGSDYEGNKMPKDIIIALLYIKEAVALTNKGLSILKPEIADIIVKVSREIRDTFSVYKENFPLVIWQTGSGTQTNMNVNEVIACRANEYLKGYKDEKNPIHPNDHVNCSQSSNDTFPTAMNLAVVLKAYTKLLPACIYLASELEKKEHIFGEIIKIGRTHMQDATPITLGQEFSGYKTQIKNVTYYIYKALEPLHYIAQGGTAVGTGLNTHKDFSHTVASKLTEITGIDKIVKEFDNVDFIQNIPHKQIAHQNGDVGLSKNYSFYSHPNKFTALGNCDDLVNFHANLSTLATALMKIANDIRFLASGPRSGIGELLLPENEPGSSIMPGKVNPTQCEALTMVASQVIGNHCAITTGGMQGHLELNVFRPMVSDNILRSMTLLSEGINSFVKNCLIGVVPNYDKIQALLDNSLMLVTALNPIFGYENAAKIAKNAYKKGITLKESAYQLDFLGDNKTISEQQWSEILDPKKMI